MGKMMTFLEVKSNEDVLLRIPFIAFVLMLVFLFWITVPLLIIGLIANCRYSFAKKEVLILESDEGDVVEEH